MHKYISAVKNDLLLNTVLRCVFMHGAHIRTVPTGPAMVRALP
jgi:hypothetical protein